MEVFQGQHRRWPTKIRLFAKFVKKQLPYSTVTTHLRTHQQAYHTSEAAEASNKQSNVISTTFFWHSTNSRHKAGKYEDYWTVTTLCDHWQMDITGYILYSSQLWYIISPIHYSIYMGWVQVHLNKLLISSNSFKLYFLKKWQPCICTALYTYVSKNTYVMYICFHEKYFFVPVWFSMFKNSDKATKII